MRMTGTLTVPGAGVFALLRDKDRTPVVLGATGVIAVGEDEQEAVNLFYQRGFGSIAEAMLAGDRVGLEIVSGGAVAY